MWVRRAFFWWLIPAAFLLPLWMLVGWIVTGAGGWALLWVLFLAIPGLFIWQVVLTLLVRARGTVRAERAVSWWDVLGFTVWHVLVIALGFFSPVWWGPLFFAALFVGVGMLWLELWQLWSEAKPSRILLRTSDGVAFIPPAAPTQPTDAAADVFIINEGRDRTAS